MLFQIELNTTQPKAAAVMSSSSDFTHKDPGKPELHLWAPSYHRVTKGAKFFAMKNRPDSAAAIFSSSAIAFWNLLVLH